MKRSFWILAVLAVVGIATFSIAQEKKAADKPAVVTMKGQVIDLACYLAKGALAGDHQGCAEACVKGGASTGFKTKDKTYLVIKDPMHQKDAPDLSKFVNKDAEITGNAFDKDGINGVVILTIK
ncbi:MAG: hypothetical protein HYR85_08570 [Planctomycetes bacterium]|nr:hypothetical protein [Planctomycetota bacterium]MBI3844355.1 hypothetical protein [Planctomycetota bacterium]